jgi:hypothetical protein
VDSNGFWKATLENACSQATTESTLVSRGDFLHSLKIGFHCFLGDIAAARCPALFSEATMNPPSALPSGTDLPTVIAVAVGLLIILILLSIWLSGPIRRLVIFIAQTFCTLVVILTTISGGATDWVAVQSLYPGSEKTLAIGMGTLFGAFLGFVIAAFLTAFLYLLIDIAENSRRAGDAGMRPPI